VSGASPTSSRPPLPPWPRPATAPQRLFLGSEPLGEFLIALASFWILSRSVWTPGARVERRRRTTGELCRPAPPQAAVPPPRVASSAWWPSDHESTLQIAPRPKSNKIIPVDPANHRSFCKKGLTVLKYYINTFPP
jgi:hypothetical protein